MRVHNNNITTAKALGKFHRELVAEGFAEDQAFALADHAARMLLHEEGLGVADEVSA